MHLAPMQTLAMGCQLALFGGASLARQLIALARFPVQSLLPLLLGATLGIVVVGIGRTPLPLHSPLQPTNLLGVWGQFLTQWLQAGFSCSRDQRNGRGPQVRSDDASPNG